ncbi:GAF domain protein [Halobacteriovorax sp. BALOs_7]|uniref:GAF domain-containing protein n=1 Tax=Halobacteriovorax sp. BALOs_7 TaxID=2109558 RepID=UPI000EA2BA4E|nr:GAF domain-containing protein [Halobacteriovorax sp. BALOs_7]AYF43309.1 GAF domain protein [Halobacteriovorax sp. BALOs_7]
MDNAQKQELYNNVKRDIFAICEGESNTIAKMATISCVLKQAFPHFYWCGFYNVDNSKESELVVGPYQGTLGCLRIPYGKGVCGTAAQSLETQIVEDVYAIENHITCDPKSQSEIVVPVLENGKLISVLDIDSDVKASFNDIDKENLEEIINRVFN